MVARICRVVSIGDQPVCVSPCQHARAPHSPRLRGVPVFVSSLSIAESKGDDVPHPFHLFRMAESSAVLGRSSVNRVHGGLTVSSLMCSAGPRCVVDPIRSTAHAATSMVSKKLSVQHEDGQGSVT